MLRPRSGKRPIPVRNPPTQFRHRPQTDASAGVHNSSERGRDPAHAAPCATRDRTGLNHACREEPTMRQWGFETRAGRDCGISLCGWRSAASMAGLIGILIPTGPDFRLGIPQPSSIFPRANRVIAACASRLAKCMLAPVGYFLSSRPLRRSETSVGLADSLPTGCQRRQRIAQP